MNKYLLAGAAAAALTLGASFAVAQDFKVTLSGEAKFEAYFSGQNKDTGSRSVDFRNRFRLNVNPEAVGLNGALTYGANILIKSEGPGSTENFEANFVYLSGAFGKIYLGDETTFNDGNGGVTKPQDFITENDGYLGYLSGTTSYAQTLDPSSGVSTYRLQTVQLGGQATRVRYDSPFISGFKFGVGYTPQGQDDAWNFNRSSGTAVQDAYEVGILFDSTDKTVADKFGAAVLKASFSYQGAKNGTAAFLGQKYEDWSTYQGGLNVGYAGFLVGGHYVDFGKSGLWKGDTKKTDNYSYGIGAQYTTGPFVVGAGYTYTQQDTSNHFNAGGYDQYGIAIDTAGARKNTAISAGVKYTVAKGLDVFADYAHVSAKNTDSNVKDNANVFILSSVLSF